DVFAPVRRRLPGRRTDRGVFYRLASWVIRRPAGTGLVVAALLVTPALPVPHAGVGIADHRGPPPRPAAPGAAATLPAALPQAAASPVTVVLPGQVTTLRSDEYKKALTAVPGTVSVTGPVTGPSGGAWYSLVTGADPNSAAAARYVAAVRAVPAPGPALVGGD